MAKIVSFYSYKGGVGRSILLANVAALLARKGKKVVCLDFDLEAGGLHSIFGVESKEINFTLLDILTLPSPLNLNRTLIDLTEKLPSPHKDGKLWLIPTVSEIRKLNDALSTNRDLSMLLSDLIKDIEEELMPHYIFVDSRSGFAELASAPLRTAEFLICVLRPNRQNTDGLKILLDILQSLRQQPPVYLVLSQVPSVEQVKERIEKLEKLLSNDRKFDLKIPYAAELALEELVATISIPDSDIAKFYNPVVDWLEEKQRNER